MKIVGSLVALVVLFSVLLIATVLGTPVFADSAATIGTNLLFNGDFDNGIWYERFRGWSPSGWYQWFTCGDDAPEHAVGVDKPHSGKEYVRIHMWAYNWRGGILQNVKDVIPGHWYEMIAYGWFAKPQETPPQAVEKIGIDPCGKLASQYSVDVTKHPAPPYNECVGDDPKTPESDYPDIPDTTVWSPTKEYYDDWGKFQVKAEARAETITAILYSESPQRAEPIYEMNWDSVSLREIPWPTKRLSMDEKSLPSDDSIYDIVVTVQPKMKTLNVTWRTKSPSGVGQILYRFLDKRQEGNALAPGTPVVLTDYPFESPIFYEKLVASHRAEAENLTIPDSAVAVEVVVLSRVCQDCECKTICSAPVVLELKK